MLGEAVAGKPRGAGDSPGTGLTADSSPGQGRATFSHLCHRVMVIAGLGKGRRE